MVLVLAVACGGPLSKAEFIEQAGAVCVELNASLERARANRSPEDAGALLRSNETANRLRREAIEEIRALGEPAEGAETIRMMLAKMEESVSKSEESFETLSSGDPAGAVALIEESSAAMQETRRLAREYGVDACARR